MIMEAPAIKLGPCKVIYGEDIGATTIDKTIGGVDFTATPTYHEIKIDQYGQGVYDKRIVGWDVKAVIRVAESTYENIKAMSAGLIEVSGAGKKKLHDAQLGTSMRESGKKLVIHPLENPDEDASDDITVYLAAPDTPIDLKYNFENERVLEVTMIAYPREGVGIEPGDANAYFCIGDETAVFSPSSAKLLLGTIYGALVGNPATGVNNVIVGLKVRDFKTGLTVSAFAATEILTGAGGTPVADQATTNVTATMKIRVTAQDSTTAEYTIAMAV